MYFFVKKNINLYKINIFTTNCIILYIFLPTTCLINRLYFISTYFIDINYNTISNLPEKTYSVNI